MKKLFAIILVLFTVSLLTTSCKDDDDNSNPANLIIGSWKMVSYVASECTDPADNENETCSTDCEITIFTNDTVTFEGETPQTYKIDGNKITFDGETYEFSVTETTLVISYKGVCKVVVTMKKV
ncbi:MAG TPA: hypothetical protein PK185_14845 [Cyclobacteriaceae bacterium]|nr:hypothetical protein [Cyclobacteriaceae bacterium]